MKIIIPVFILISFISFISGDLFAVSSEKTSFPLINDLVYTSKLDFTAEWKEDSRKNIIILKLSGNQSAVNCFIYDNSPFLGGNLIKQVDNINTNKIEIELDKKADVYICIYQNEENVAGKWLHLSK